MHVAPKAVNAWLSEQPVCCVLHACEALLRRLKKAEQFAAALQASKLKQTDCGIWRSRHFVLHMAPQAVVFATPSPASSKEAAQVAKNSPIVGVICPKRWAKHAVTRNTIKRQIYAVTQQLAPQLPSACLVLRLAVGFSRQDFPSASSAALKRAVRQELAQLLALLSKNAASALPGKALP